MSNKSLARIIGNIHIGSIRMTENLQNTKRVSTEIHNNNGITYYVIMFTLK